MTNKFSYSFAIILTLLTCLFVPNTALANQAYNGQCSVGNVNAKIQGLNSSNTLIGSYPQCTVTVFVHGTTTLATLYSNNLSSPTPLSNPFTASTNGSYFFYAPLGHYDITMSGGLNGGFPSPVTISDVLLQDLESGGLPSPPAYSFQFANSTVGAFQGNSNSQFNTAYSQAVNKLPRVNVLHSDFASSCANAADPTGTLDSTCAIQAAITYAYNTNTNGQTPAVYLPEGTYKLSSALRVNCNVSVDGDAHGSTVLTQTNNNANIFTVIPANATQADGYLCQGEMSNMMLTTTGSHLHVANLLEEDNAAGYNTYNLVFFNSGGRGLVLNGSSERGKNYNIRFDSIGHRSAVIGANANEVDFFGLQVNGPGATNDGYCFGSTCVNGVAPSTAWTQTQVLISASGNGTTATYVVQGGNSGSTNNGQSPLAVGHYFNVSGVTGNTGLNGTFQVTSVTNTSPTSTEYTLTATNASSGSGVVSSATFKPAMIPDHHGAVWMQSVRDHIEGGSMKALTYEPGIQVRYAEAAEIKNYYLEGFPVHGSPRLNSAIELVGLAPITSTAASLSASGTSVTLSDLGEWFPQAYTDPQDNTSGCQQYVLIEPQDFQINSTTPSAYVSGITQGEYEVACYSGIDFTNGMKFTNRFVASDRSYTTSVPNTTVWPAGSIIVMPTDTPFYGNGILVADTHVNSVYTAGSTSNWSANCVDTNQFICADIIMGPIEDGYSVAPPGTSGFPTGSSAALSLLGNSYYIATPLGTYEAQGQGYIKSTLYANVLSLSAGIGNQQKGETGEIFSGTFTNNSSSPLYQAISYSTGSSSQIYAYDPGYGFFYSNAYGANATNVEYLQRVNAVSSLLGNNAGNSPPFGFQYSPAFSFWDVAPTSSGTGHAQTRFMLTGGAIPNTQPAWEHDYWNGTAWQYGSGCSLDYNVAYQDDCFFGTLSTNNLQPLNNSLEINNIGMGYVTNWVPYSYNYTASPGGGLGWKILNGTAPTITTVSDSTAPFSHVTQFTTTSALTDWGYGAATNQLTVGQVYTLCAFMKGATGTEVVGVQADSLPWTRGNVTLSTTWGYYCGTVLASSSANVGQIFGFTSTVNAETFYVAGVTTSTGTSSAYVDTNGSPITTQMSAIYAPASTATVGTLVLPSITSATCLSTNSSGQVQTGTCATSTTPIRAGSWSISSSTSVAVTFSTPMTAAPICTVSPSASAASTGTPFGSSPSTTGFTVNVPTSGTISGSYICSINNAN